MKIRAKQTFVGTFNMKKDEIKEIVFFAMERANARMAVMYSNIGILTVSRNLYIAGG